MFTIKHIHIGGDEDIHQCEAVRYSMPTSALPSSHGDSPQSSATPATIWVVMRGDFVERTLTGGTIFVMNDAGKTVARYDLGASPVPIVGDGLADPRSRGTLAA